MIFVFSLSNQILAFLIPSWDSGYQAGFYFAIKNIIYKSSLIKKTLLMKKNLLRNWISFLVYRSANHLLRNLN